MGVVAAMAMTSCGGPSVCECVNMADDADEATKTACEEMEKEWKSKYDEASDEEKESMMKEIMACGEGEEESHEEEAH